MALAVSAVLSLRKFFFLMIRRSPTSTLFPYTTLFRSSAVRDGTHWKVVGAPVCRDRTGYRLQRQRHRQRHAARSFLRSGQHHELEARFARDHFRWKSCLYCGSSGHGGCDRKSVPRECSAHGEYLFGRLAEWTKKFKIVGDVRGRGLMIGIEIVRDQRTKEKAADLRNAIIEMAFYKGLC